jgi:hypothetical protein
LKLVFCGTLILLFIVIRLSGEATAVVKFLIGRSPQPKNCAHEPNRCPLMFPYGKIFLEGTGLRKIR